MPFAQHLSACRPVNPSRRTVVAVTLILAVFITLVPLSAYTRSHFPRYVYPRSALLIMCIRRLTQGVDQSVDTFHSKLRDHFGSIKDSTHSALFGYRQCPANCPSDPYVQPGMLYFGNSSRDTRWVPFPVEEIEVELVDGKALKLSEIDHLDVSGVEEYGAEALMAGLVDGKEKVIGWARDKYVLFVGESIWGQQSPQDASDQYSAHRREVSLVQDMRSIHRV